MPSTALSADAEPQHLIGLGERPLGVVGDDDAGAALAGADQGLGQLAPLGVEVGVGLVEQQQLGLVQDAAADREALAHPGGEIADAVVGAALHPDRGEQARRSVPPQRRRRSRAAWRGSGGSRDRSGRGRGAARGRGSRPARGASRPHAAARTRAPAPHPRWVAAGWRGCAAASSSRRRWALGRPATGRPPARSRPRRAPSARRSRAAARLPRAPADPRFRDSWSGL